MLLGHNEDDTKVLRPVSNYKFRKTRSLGHNEDDINVLRHLCRLRFAIAPATFAEKDRLLRRKYVM